jgi:murein DD-endopeptidase MepM/ murein hydrolase activator NlpD
LHIILVSNRLATARTLTITPRLALATAFGFVFLAFLTSFLFSWVGVRFNLPFAERLVASVQHAQTQKTQEFVRDNLNTMAVKLGEMQAQLLRLDSLGERVSALSGIKPPEKSIDGKGGQGGPLLALSEPLSPLELQREVDRLAQIVEQRSDDLTALESQLMERRIKANLLPTILPIEASHIGSTFGHRLDPIASVHAMHEGIDFVAEPGTRVISAAGGVVAAAEFHPQYGNLIEIDHGNDFSSRYAHLSKMLVKPGQVIKRGQEIGASGNTGRSTGPHMHFEVRYKGAAQNPARFLQQKADAVPGAKLANKAVGKPGARSN